MKFDIMRYSEFIKTTSIIRERGQLTIPESIRKEVSWINPQSAVTISVTKPDEIVIHPHQTIIDSNVIWKRIQKSRSTNKKGSISAIDSLKKDRKSH